MPTLFMGNYPLVEYLSAVTGWDLDVAEVLTTGARIQTLRQCFNIREGIGPADIHLPARMTGLPPMKDGPLAGITIDAGNLARKYRRAIGWDPESDQPKEEELKRLGISDLIQN